MSLFVCLLAVVLDATGFPCPHALGASACLPGLCGMQQLQHMMVFVLPCMLHMVAITQWLGFWACRWCWYAWH